MKSFKHLFKTFFYVGIVVLTIIPTYLFAQIQEKNDSIQVLKEVILLEYNHSQSIENDNSFESIEEVVSRISGTELVSRGNYAQDPVIRGKSKGQINVLLNDMRIFGACTDRMDPVTSYAETTNLDKISISKGEETNCHDNSGGGTVNMSLHKAGFNPGIQTSIKSGLGYYSNSNGIKTFLGIDHNREKLGVHAQGVIRDHNNYHSGGGNEVIHSQYKKFNFSTNVAYRISKKETIRVEFLFDEARDVGYPALPMDVSLAKANIGGLSYSKFGGEMFNQISFKIYGNKIHHIMDDSQRENVPIRMDMPGWSNTYGAWLKLSSNTLGQHKLDGMIEFYNNYRRGEMTMFPKDEIPMFMLTWPDANRSTYGVGVSDNWKISEKATLNSSVRFDVNFTEMQSDLGRKYFEIFGKNTDQTYIDPIVNLKLNFKQSIADNFFLNVNAAFAERVPETSEQFGFYLYNAHDNHDYIGDPDIENERSFQLSTGIEKNNDNYSLNALIFYNHINQYILGSTSPSIDPMTIGAEGVRVYQNIDFAKLYGFEASGSIVFKKHFRAGSNIQFVRGETYDKNNLPLIAPLNAFIWLKYQTFKDLNLIAESKMAASQNNVNQEFGDLPTPGYAIFNFRISKEIKWNQSSIFLELGCDNIFDTWYRDHMNWAQIPNPGRNLKIQVIYSLN